MTGDGLRLLVIDPTPIGSLCATGQFKGMLFRDWPANDIIELTTDFNGDGATVLRWGLDLIERFTAPEEAISRIQTFAPQAIYVRPEPSAIRHFDALLVALEALPQPAALHIMDDWVAGDFIPTQAGMDALVRISRYFARRATLRYTDGPAYIADFKQRLDADFSNLLNAVDRERWSAPIPARQADQPFVLTHMGNWDREMSRQAVIEIAAATERLQAEFDISVHVHVRDYVVPEARADLAQYSRAHVFEQQGDFEAYVGTLRRSDVNLYAYNQDPISVRYMGKGIPNKTCELLAAGKPILAYGPEAFGGIRYLREHDAACIVNARSDLDEAIRGLHRSAARSAAMSARGEKLLRDNHDATRIRTGFLKAMRSLGATMTPAALDGLATDASRDWHDLLRPQIMSYRYHRSRVPRIYAVETEAKALRWRLDALSAKVGALGSAARAIGEMPANAIRRDAHGDGTH